MLSSSVMPAVGGTASRKPSAHRESFASGTAAAFAAVFVRRFAASVAASVAGVDRLPRALAPANSVHRWHST